MLMVILSGLMRGLKLIQVLLGKMVARSTLAARLSKILIALQNGYSLIRPAQFDGFLTHQTFGGIDGAVARISACACMVLAKVRGQAAKAATDHDHGRARRTWPWLSAMNADAVSSQYDSSFISALLLVPGRRFLRLHYITVRVALYRFLPLALDTSDGIARVNQHILPPCQLADFACGRATARAASSAASE
jgi:hypothetical protein